MRNIIALRIFAVFMLCMQVHAAQAESLIDIYQKALRSDPSLREADANRLATLESRPQAIAALLPQIDADATYNDDSTQGSRDTTVGGVTAPSKFDNDSDGWRWNVQLRQTLFRWDQWLILKQSDKQLARAEADYRAAGQDLMIRVSTAYFDVLAAQDTLVSEQAAKEAIGRQLEQAQKRFEVGLIAITDVQEAQAAYDQAIATEISAKRSLATSREAVREIVGEYTQNLDGPQAEIPLVSPNPEDEDAWVATALQQNLSLQASEIAAQITRDDVRLARTGYYPTVDLVMTHTDTNITGEGTTTGPDGTGNIVTNRNPVGTSSEQDTIQVQFAVPIFSGGATNSKVREAVYRHRAAREQFERVARETERQTRDSYLGVISEISRVKALKQAQKSAQTALQATQAGYEVGTRTTVDVLDGRRQLFIADVNYSRSRYDYILNVLLLKQAAGTLTVDDLLEVNSWLEEQQEQAASTNP
jgi:outer membrane protein